MIVHYTMMFKKVVNVYQRCHKKTGIIKSHLFKFFSLLLIYDILRRFYSFHLSLGHLCCAGGTYQIPNRLRPISRRPSIPSSVTTAVSPTSWDFRCASLGSAGPEGAGWQRVFEDFQGRPGECCFPGRWPVRWRDQGGTCDRNRRIGDWRRYRGWPLG